MIRSFIAVDIDAQVIAKLAAMIEQLKPQLTGVRWAAPGNIHLTLKFLGNIEESKINPIADALRSRLRLFRPFSISVKALGVFPGPRQPRVLWVGLSSARLATLASEVEFALRPLGFTPESRAFTPHLTIGRWREKSPAPASLTMELAKWRASYFGDSEVAHVRLMQSVLGPGGAEYRPLAVVPFRGDP